MSCPACGHKFADLIRKPRQIRCIGCGRSHALGPSRDTPEALVELRAAEIAVELNATLAGNLAAFGEMRGGTEAFGYWLHHTHQTPVGPHESAGWLAREIVWHNFNQEVA
jgi:hypothetical protein